MLKTALAKMLAEVLVALAGDILEALRGVKDRKEAEARLRALAKQRGNEEIHNAIVRATR